MSWSGGLAAFALLCLVGSVRADIVVFDLADDRAGTVFFDHAGAVVARSVEQATSLRSRQLVNEALSELRPKLAFHCKNAQWFAVIQLQDWTERRSDRAGACQYSSRRAAIQAAVESCLAKPLCGRLIRSQDNGAGGVISGYDDPAFDPERAFAEARARERATPGLRVGMTTPRFMSCDRSGGKGQSLVTRCSLSASTEPVPVDLLRFSSYPFTD